MTHVAYVLDQFPVVSQTFVSDEIHSVCAAGAQCSVFALRPAPDGVVHARARELLDAGRVITADHWGGGAALAALAYLGLRHPLRTAKVMMQALRDKRFRWCARLALPIAREVMRRNCTHVHSHFADTGARVAMWVHRWTGIPFTFTTHGYDVFDTPPPDMREMTADAAAMVCISRFNVEYLQRTFGLPAEKLHVIRCGIYCEEFQGTYRSLSADSPEVRILCVARLEAVKGHEHLLAAVRLLVDAGLKPVVRLVGDGRLGEKLKEQANSLGVGAYVEFLGARTANEVKELLAWSDVFVLPSVREGVPIVIMECMSSARPVVATAISGIPELVAHRVSGLLCPPGDPRALADAVQWIRQNPDATRNMVAAARAVIEGEFNRVECTRQLMHLWKNVP